MPAPPSTTNAPVVVDVLELVFVILTTNAVVPVKLPVTP